MEDTTIERPQTPKSLKFLYYTKLGGVVLRLLTRRWVSRLAGRYLDSRLSKAHIKKYIKRHGIDTSDYVEEKYKSFNAFFTRNIKPELRPFDTDPTAFVAPCDGKLSAYEITADGEFEIKGFSYTVESLLKNAELAKKYDGGLCLVFRLTVSDYHRYRFIDGGTVDGGVFIKGRLHTVQPAALGARRVFTENCREYAVLHTDNFGDVTQVEVGAMMVGRIVNTVKSGRFERGEQKGMFEFGGSTVVLLVEKDRVKITHGGGYVFETTRLGAETPVKCGEKIGEKIERVTAE